MADHSHHHMMMMTTTPAMEMDHSMGHNVTMPPGHHDMSGHDMPDMSGHDMMKMYFHFGYVNTVLFKGWPADSAGRMLGTCIAIFLVAFLYEGLKMFRESLLHKYHQSLSLANPSLENGRPVLKVSPHSSSFRDNVLMLPHLMQTILHMLQLTISYLLMLVFMTFNIWLCLSVVLGAGAGFLMFGWRRTLYLDATEHCH